MDNTTVVVYPDERSDIGRTVDVGSPPKADPPWAEIPARCTKTFSTDEDVFYY